MDFKSLNKKVKEGVVNMARPSVLFNDIEGEEYMEHYITSDEVCRVDLISLDEYVPELNQIKAQFLETKRLTEADIKRVEYLKAKAEKKANGSSVPAPPNLLKPGDSNIQIANGNISLNPTAFSRYKNRVKKNG